MCGIAAHFSFRAPATPLDLQLIAHRGPDAAGEWISADRRFWLGNTRLAILDLSPTGAQPMVDSATGNVIVANGEIYNHRALRAEMRRRGLARDERHRDASAGLRALGSPIARSAEGNVRLHHLRSRSPGAFRGARSPWHQAALLHFGCRKYPPRLRGKGSHRPGFDGHVCIDQRLSAMGRLSRRPPYLSRHPCPSGRARHEHRGRRGETPSSRGRELSCTAICHPRLDGVSPHRP